MGELQNRLTSHREAIIRIAEAHGASNVRVFGSAARGDDQPGSDVDLLVDLAPERGLFDLIDLKLALNELLARPVDVVSESGLYWLLRRRIVREARPL